MYQISVKSLNITAVGDDYTGKSSLLSVYATKEFPEDMDTNKKLYNLGRFHIILKEEEFYLTLKAAPGEKYYDDFRVLWYKNTDCFFICYSISSSESLVNIEKKWFPEIRRFAKSTPIILVDKGGQPLANWMILSGALHPCAYNITIVLLSPTMNVIKKKMCLRGMAHLNSGMIIKNPQQIKKWFEKPWIYNISKTDQDSSLRDTKAVSHEIECSATFSLTARHSFYNYLVYTGTMADLRNTEPADTLVTTEEGKALASKIQANAFVECSALNSENIDKLFAEAAIAIICKTNDYDHIPDFEEIDTKELDNKKQSSTKTKDDKSKTSERVQKENGNNGKVKRNKTKENNKVIVSSEMHNEQKDEIKNKEFEIKTPEQLAKESGRNGKVKRIRTKENKDVKKSVDKPVVQKESDKETKCIETIVRESRENENLEQLKEIIDETKKTENINKTQEEKDTGILATKIQVNTPNIQYLIKQFESGNSNVKLN